MLINSNVILLNQPKYSVLTESQAYPSHDTKSVQFNTCWAENDVITDPSWESRQW